MQDETVKSAEMIRPLKVLSYILVGTLLYTVLLVTLTQLFVTAL
ncbi:hypothetical protein [Acinetobacter variabilis]|nr:hypothetical protein RYU24_06670 [Acinetobacter variabilis]